jgi:hypothetical protein
MKKSTTAVKATLRFPVFFLVTRESSREKGGDAHLISKSE